MKRLILTGWCGNEFAEIAANTLPIVARYASLHGVEHACANLGISPDVPPSWAKVRFLIGALGSFDSVLWIDADVVIVDETQNIFDEIDSLSWQSVVTHQTECGEVPNCGVWHVTKHMLPTLEHCWSDLLHVYRDHAWWEQAAIMSLMGYSVASVAGRPRGELVSSTALFSRTQSLDPKWNHHPADSNRTDTPAFVHVTQYEDRIDTVRRLCAEAA